jgi:hypothetical protein
MQNKYTKIFKEQAYTFKITIKLDTSRTGDVSGKRYHEIIIRTIRNKKNTGAYKFKETYITNFKLDTKQETETFNNTINTQMQHAIRWAKEQCKYTILEQSALVNNGFN